MIACAIFAQVRVASANDASFRGSGADLVPLEQSEVRMESEDIVLESRARKWHVSASYVFENQGASEVKLQVGFPEYRCAEDQEDDCGGPFEGLVTKVNGAVVPQRTGKVGKKHDWARRLSVVWLFDVTFASGAKTRIEHTYALESGSDIGGNSSTSYVTRTGAKWAGTIGRATFTLKLPLAAHSISAAGIELKHAELKDPETKTPYVQAVFERTNWEPSNDLRFFFNDTTAGGMVGLPPLLDPERLQEIGLSEGQNCDFNAATAAAWQACKNLIYAIHGYPFKSESLRKAFYGGEPAFRQLKDTFGNKWWVRGLRALPAFEPAWIVGPNAERLSWLEKNRPPGATETEALAAAPEAAASGVAPAPVIASAAPVANASSAPKPNGSACGCRVVGGPASVAWPWSAALVWLLRRRSRQGLRTRT